MIRRTFKLRIRLVFALVCLLGIALFYAGFRAFADFGFLEASRRTDVGAMRVWLRLGANIDFQDVKRTPLQWAIEESNRKAALALLKLGANPNVRWQDEISATALMTATAENWPDVVEALLQRGANVSDKNRLGQTALELARPNSEVADILARPRQTP